MHIILSLIFLPLLVGLFLLASKNERLNAWIIRAASAGIIGLSILVCVLFFDRRITLDFGHIAWLGYTLLALEACMSIYIIYVGLKHKHYFTALLSAVQISVAAWFELMYAHHIHVAQTLDIDKFSLLMILIIGVIGSLICIYSVTYFRDYHAHHTDVKDRRNRFFGVMFLFLSAMFGLILADHLLWFLFFWEVTSLCSFLLIRYTRTPKAMDNAFRALTVNVGGGLALTAGVAIVGIHYQTLGLEAMTHLNTDLPVLYTAVFLMGLAALAKSAQMPFSRWLLGAMVAPTPSSALLHSATMVKAGVYLIIRLAPLLGGNYVGTIFMMIGGFTFIMTAVLAVAQTDAKKLLAYSTVSNLGLIIVCASIGTEESLWAAIMLIVFHAIAKSLLFLSVGSTEHCIGSRDIENMEGLIKVSIRLTMCLIIGIAGMFLAPFGMLISKWAAMKAFIDSGNILVVVVVAFGSSITLFFWTKWMGKLIQNASGEDETQYVMSNDERIALYVHAVLVVLVCIGFPLMSGGIILPYLEGIFNNPAVSPIQSVDTTLIIVMMCILFLLSLALIPLYRKNKVKQTSVYLSGQNTGDDISFYGSMGEIHKLEHKNWYMAHSFGDKKLQKYSLMIAWGMLAVSALVVLGGVLWLF